jgi:predicted phosphodiesterase
LYETSVNFKIYCSLLVLGRIQNKVSADRESRIANLRFFDTVHPSKRLTDHDHRYGAAGMRIVVLSDIHGNLTAFEAVLADVQRAAPDTVFHGGDLSDGGSSPVEIIDQIRDLGWHGVMGNGDEMLHRPEALEEFAAQSSAPSQLWTSVREMAEATRSMLGSSRLSWLSQLPSVLLEPDLGIVHASPHTSWKAAPPHASDEELGRIYSSLGKALVVFGHTHLPFIRKTSVIPELLVNTGSVGLPYDGDPRASYLMLDGDVPSIRRVEYDLDKELKRLSSSTLPHADWTARMLRSSSPQLP